MKVNAIKNIASNEFVFKASAKAVAEIIGINKRAIILQVPAVKINWNLMYLLTGTVSLAGKETAFEFTGKLHCLEDLGEAMRIQFDLLQFDRTLWLQVLQQLELKQTKADKIFRSIKGET